jgi:dihydroorotate dehydrogenase electron transfer subunit
MDLLFELPVFIEYGCQVQLATEDGSGGVTGFATLPLARHLERLEGDELSAHILFACGPTPFLKAVAELCRPRGPEAQLSLEERMGCGIGACMGCSIKIQGKGGFGQKRVCHDGPVFPAAEVVFDG